jgi:hypothetical protein
MTRAWPTSREECKKVTSKVNCFNEDVKGTLWFEDRLVVPNIVAIKKKILDEARTSRYSTHPGST